MSIKKGIKLIIIFAVVLILGGVVIGILKMEDKNMELTCMSFNILGFENEGYLPVAKRAQHMKSYLNESGMDLIGLQEAGSHDYDWQEYFVGKIEGDGIYKAVTIGAEKSYDEQASRYPAGRVSNSAGLIILYKAERFELLESGSQRYSSTERQERHYQWAKLKDKETGETVFMTNTHWSINWDENGKVSPEAGDAHRTKEANELRTFWEENVGDCILFATGDYNSRQDTTWIQSAEKGIYKTAEHILNDDRELQIDHIFLNPKRVEVETYYFLKDKIELEDGSYRYSDHDPLVVKVKYKE